MGFFYYFFHLESIIFDKGNAVNKLIKLAISFVAVKQKIITISYRGIVLLLLCILDSW